ncbi:hypothetical protein HNR67_001049 [Crossiella cryophila]|uniref:Uncharacterized protein n=1 Tax=Crossiella cryophila TaxID=43355 RepID=A0A7W7FQG8_9PSEU|nr:hypothetical protein [Crossiella cryophila]
MAVDSNGERGQAMVLITGARLVTLRDPRHGVGNPYFFGMV